MKSYTDLEQSKKLAEILPIESADSHYVRQTHDFRGNTVDGKWSHPKYGNPNSRYANYIVQNFSSYETILCWSLAALLDILPNDWWGYNKHYFLEISKMGDMSAPYIVSYFRFREQSDGANFGRIIHISFQSDNPIDACVEMVKKLHELKLL